MARILGVEIPNNKKIYVSLQSIYGIGLKTSYDILNALEIDPEMKTKELTDDQISKLSHYINETYLVEGDLRQETNKNIKRLIEIGSYRGKRHKAKLPVRGQKTHANARTRKGPRLTKIRKK